MKPLYFTTKGRLMNTIEKFFIYRETQTTSWTIDSQYSLMPSMKPWQIFTPTEVIHPLHNYLPRRTTYYIQFCTCNPPSQTPQTADVSPFRTICKSLLLHTNTIIWILDSRSLQYIIFFIILLLHIYIYIYNEILMYILWSIHGATYITSSYK
jgi:hypothetical protein